MHVMYTCTCMYACLFACIDIKEDTLSEGRVLHVYVMGVQIMTLDSTTYMYLAH